LRQKSREKPRKQAKIGVFGLKSRESPRNSRIFKLQKSLFKLQMSQKATFKATLATFSDI